MRVCFARLLMLKPQRIQTQELLIHLQTTMVSCQGCDRISSVISSDQTPAHVCTHVYMQSCESSRHKYKHTYDLHIMAQAEDTIAMQKQPQDDGEDLNRLKIEVQHLKDVLTYDVRCNMYLFCTSHDAIPLTHQARVKSFPSSLQNYSLVTRPLC